MNDHRAPCILPFLARSTSGITIGPWQRVALSSADQNRYRLHCSRLIEQLASVAVSVLTATGTTGIPVAPFAKE
ncbi:MULTISPECIES: hypothetical protein [Pseudomonas syringae group]|uniref:hypothetical protein n=1 Tax=Pseudomonas syringae group TaxID=136849 RepID=UPI0004123014|nr:MULTISPECIES: hypothetical protein [Pseudomonas syringae group]